MKRHTTLLLIFTLGFCFFAVSSEQPLVSVEQLTAYDANGRRIAPVISIDKDIASAVVALRRGDLLITLTVFREGLAAPHIVAFESSNCSGQAYILPPAPTPPFPMI